MSPDLERRLREGREALPNPDPTATEQARKRALAAIRTRRPHARAAGLVGLGLILALALGAGLGALLAPSGTAASGPLGTGFLPESGWTVLQSGADATPERQALAVAANVPLHPEDSARGIRASSGLPYETLLRLPRRGVVIVALFTVRGPFTWQDEAYPRRELPLRFRSAARSNYFSVPVRPDRPLGQYQLRATVNDHYVDLYLYFGTSTPSPALVATAEEQLKRLVVGSLTPDDARATRLGSAGLVTAGSGGSAQSRIVDRTFLCKPVAYDGIGEIDIAAGPPLKTRFGSRTAHLIVGTGTTLPSEDLVFVRSLAQARVGTTSPFPGPAGVYAHAHRCTTSRSRIELSSIGLPGQPVRFATDLTCSLRGRVVVRVRARLAAPVVWRRAYEPFLVGVRGRVEDAQLAVRGASSGAPLAYMTVDRAGKTRLWSSFRCT